MFISKDKFFHLSKNKTTDEYIRLGVYATLLLIVPIFLGHQLFVGIIVNALLIISALEHSIKKMAILCLLPSLAVISTSFLFGGLTPVLLLMLPFIWIGNFIIVVLSKRLFLSKGKNYFLSTTMATIAKTIFLFISVVILFTLGLVPTLFLTAFGIMQLITAQSASIIIGFIKLRKH